MARTPTWKRWTILFCGLIENLVFSGSILGWSALNYMLKQEGIFESVCYDEISSSRTSLSLNPYSQVPNLDAVIKPSLAFDLPSSSPYINYSIHPPRVTNFDLQLLNTTTLDGALNSTFDYMVTDLWLLLLLLLLNFILSPSILTLSFPSIFI